LRLYHEKLGSAQGRREVTQRVEEHCEQMVILKGASSFHVFSTKRQFQRYVEWWTNSLWNEIAHSAVNCLER